MVEGYAAAVGHHAVDEFHLLGLSVSDRIAVERRLSASGSPASRRSQMLSWWIAITPRRQPVAPKYFE